MAIVVSGSNVTFLDAVNRILRINHIIKGDDDNITSFGDDQHAADIEIAQLAVQSELSDLVSNKLVDNEKASGTVTLATGTRTYSLATDFVRFYGTNASFFDSTDNTRIYELKGGLDKLRDMDFQYDTNQGSPDSWYWEPGTSHKVGFYSVPDSTYSGRSLQYDYEKSIMIENATDDVPFNRTEVYYAFCDCAARRFKQIDNTLAVPLNQDGMWLDARSRLMDLHRTTNPPKYYGRRHG
jgi:hypothetical protein